MQDGNLGLREKSAHNSLSDLKVPFRNYEGAFIIRKYRPKGF